MKPARRYGRRAGPRGFSLIELLISFALLGTFLGALILVLGQGTKAARTGMARQSMEGLVRRTLDRLAGELQCAVAETLDPDPSPPWGGSSLSFQRIGGYEDGEVQWGELVQFSLAIDDGEQDDGEDDDGDGLIDERKLLFTRDLGGPEEQAITLAHGVREYLEGELSNGKDDNGNGLLDEAGLSFEHTGGQLVLRLSLEERDLEGNLLAHTVQTSVRLRN